MNPLTRRRGFTLTEMLVVIAIIGILAALLLPAIARSQLRAKRIWCINNLQQTGMGFQMFAHDHNGNFPMEVPISEGGTKEFVQAGYDVGAEFYFAYRHFQALSNDLREPGVLVCPTDTRGAAANIGSLQNSNVSYFVGVYADFGKPISILAGDRNIESVFGSATILTDDVGNRLRWTKEMHQFKGNILFADDHVEQWNNANFPTNGDLGNHQDFFLPSVPGQTANPGGNYNGGRRNSGQIKPPSHSPPQRSPTQSMTSSPMPQAMPQNSVGGNAGNQIVSREILSRQTGIILTNSVNTNAVRTNFPPAALTNSETMSDFDQHIVKTLQRAFGWLYFLLLILLLLLLLYWLLRRGNEAGEKK